MQHQKSTYAVVDQQPRLEGLTPEELEQYKGVQKWANIRRERRIAAGLDPDDESREVKKERKEKPIKEETKKRDERSDEGEDAGSNKCWACLTCCCLCSNCYF